MQSKSAKVLKYDAVFEEQPGGGYTVTVPALPGCISEGDSLGEAKKNIAEAITVYVESLELDGEAVPAGDAPVFVEEIQIHRPAITP